MKKLLLPLLLLCAFPLLAQTGTHSVMLTWTQSTSTGVTSNNVYRGAPVSGSCASTTYSLLWASSTPVTSFSDVSLLAGQYCYVVTALVNTAESAYSGSVLATVVDVNPPGTPTAKQTK